MKYLLSFGFLLVATIVFGQAQQATLLGRWTDDSLPSSAAHNNRYNEVWGFVAETGEEIAVIGTTLGTHFIDVTDPENPVELGVVEGGSIGPQIIHRDFHDYRNYLYTTADEGGNTSLQIIDISKLPDTIDVVYDSQEFFTRSHNIYIDTATARLYSCISNGSVFGFSPMRVFDISDPLDPQPLASFSKLDDYDISQVHDAFVRNDTAYLNLGPRGFAIADMSNIDTPVIITVLRPEEYPQAGYNHSGWLTDDGDYYYMADENWEKDIKVLDLRNLPDVDVVHTFNADSDEGSIAHNQIVWDNKLYVSYYFDGLQVYDLQNPAKPERIWYYDTSSEPARPNLYRGAWGVYPALPSGNILVSDMQNGLFIVKEEVAPTSAENIAVAKVFELNGNMVTEQITIESQASVDYSIMDLEGRTVASFVGEGLITKSVSSLAKGMYVLVGVQNGVRKTERFFKL